MSQALRIHPSIADLNLARHLKQKSFQTSWPPLLWLWPLWELEQRVSVQPGILLPILRYSVLILITINVALTHLILTTFVIVATDGDRAKQSSWRHLGLFSKHWRWRARSTQVGPFLVFHLASLLYLFLICRHSSMYHNLTTNLPKEVTRLIIPDEKSANTQW